MKDEGRCPGAAAGRADGGHACTLAGSQTAGACAFQEPRRRRGSTSRIRVTVSAPPESSLISPKRLDMLGHEQGHHILC